MPWLWLLCIHVRSFDQLIWGKVFWKTDFPDGLLAEPALGGEVSGIGGIRAGAGVKL